MTATYEALVDDLGALGVREVFGLMSDDTAVFATAIDSAGIRFYGARHENNAIAMAEGYAYATGGLGVAVIGRGPATANGLHAATYASRTGSRVLIIYGEAAVPGGAPNGLGPDYKGFNATGVLAAAGLRTFVAIEPADGPRRAGRRSARRDAGRRGGAAAAGQRAARGDRRGRIGGAPDAAGRASAGGAAAAGHRGGRCRSAPEPQASDPGRAGRPSRRREGRDRSSSPIASARCWPPRRGARTCSAAIPPTSASSARSRIPRRGAWSTRPTACWCSAPGSTC